MQTMFGSARTLGPRSIEWMQAGGGVWHGGGPSGGASLRGFQLWIALPPPLELAIAFSDYVDDDSIPRDGDTRLLLGTYRGKHGPIPYEEPVTYLSVQLRDGERWTYRPSLSHHVAWLAVAIGALLVDGQSLRWNEPVFSPSMPDETSLFSWAARDGDFLSFDLPMYGDSQTLARRRPPQSLAAPAPSEAGSVIPARRAARSARPSSEMSFPMA